MPFPIKPAVAGLALVGVGGAGILLNHLSKMPKGWVHVKSVSHTGKYAADYAKFLVDSEDEKNDEWWKWSYWRQYKSDATEGFSKDSVSDWKKLREVCKKAYDSGTGVDGSTNTISNTTEPSTKYKEEDVWRFCSPGKGKPKTLDAFKDKSEEEKNKLEKDWKDKLGGKYKGILLSVADSDNEWVWKIRDGEFKGSENNTETNKFFSKPADGNSVHIKDKCKEAYGKDETSGDGAATDPTKDDVIKWCSIKGKE